MPTKAQYKTLEADIRDAIVNRKKRDSLVRCMERGRDSRAERLESLPGGDAFRAQVKEIKDRCRDCQDELLQRFVKNLQTRGVTVYLARDAADANQYVLNLARERGAALIAKSKSLTTEEIELNRPLEEAGIRVIETDLGELIIQMVNEKPFHLVFPSVHKNAEDVAKLFQEKLGRHVPNDIDAIMRIVREYLRPIFLDTDIGITGANIGIAETGGIVIETNEGNGRLVSSIGDCHICVMGREKIVETIDEALMMVMAHPVSASGQLPTTYVTWLHGRSPMGHGGDAPRESHVVILDNGRSQMRDDPIMKEALSCIRCGACMNICPTYGVVGGHTFGHIYPGPIGIPWTAAAHGLDTAAAFAPLCVSCGLCKEICPADIDMPFMIAEVKNRARKLAPPSRAEKTMIAADRMAALGSATAPIANAALKNPAFRAILERVAGVDRRRELPPFHRAPFIKRFRKRPKPDSATKRKVALFVDVYANYNAPHLAMAAVDRLEALQCEVIVPDQKPAGYPLIAYGDLDAARILAEQNVRTLAPYARDGYTFIAIEPTAAYTLQKIYPKLLPNDPDAPALAATVTDLFAFLTEHAPPPNDPPLAGRRLGLHCSCHQRPIGNGAPLTKWLRQQGAHVLRVETGTCCGMGGTFGLKAGALGYDLAQAVGEPLFQRFEQADIDTIVTESSVCAIHLREGTNIQVQHPLELLG